jgi:hypothetical protein
MNTSLEITSLHKIHAKKEFVALIWYKPASNSDLEINTNFFDVTKWSVSTQLPITKTMGTSKN